MITHGLRNTKEYGIWNRIKDRCYNVNNKRYQDYGGRGICMSDEWKKFFKAFYEDMGNRPSDKHSVDRIDNDGNYCKENCKWSTDIEQANNKRNNVIIEYKGESLNITQWSKRIGINPETLRVRMTNGWTNEEIIETPLQEKQKLITFNGKTQNIQNWSKETGISKCTIGQRLLDGWSIEEALTKPTKESERILSYNGESHEQPIPGFFATRLVGCFIIRIG